MRLHILLVICLLGLLCLPTRRVLADNGPHGGYTATTDSCAGCHRAHSAPVADLLEDNVSSLCYTCHGNAGTGADTNVVDGVYLERDANNEIPPEGIPNRGLRGGGFVNALMDSNRDGASASTPSTSTHLSDGSSGIAWGNGAIGSGSGASISLSCTSCHDPHGGGTYRILRTTPIGSGAELPVIVGDEVIKNYTVISDTNAYIGDPYGVLAAPLSSWCSQCHTRYTADSGSGHTYSGDDIFAYRHTTAGVNCVGCHVAHGSSAVMGDYSGAVLWPDGTNTPGGDLRSSLLRVDNRGVCAYCHVEPDGTVGGGCDTCHGAPPATGAHSIHSGVGAVGYGLTGSFATASNYQYGCGECHPTDIAMHLNGSVDVNLSSNGALNGSLKEQNSPAATYSGGSCSGVYCHSGIQETSGPVGAPLVDGGGNYIFDVYFNFTYAPYTVSETRLYQVTPAWSGGSITGCSACHAFPLTTAYPGLEAGVGNSHQWVDDYGYGNLPAYNMGYDPISCRTCHYDEITQANTWSRVGDVTTYDPVLLASRVVHANGQPNVTFDSVNPIVYNTGGGPVTYSLTGSAYQPAERACTNVACHQLQSYVQWGTPYRWWTNECDLCHRFSLPIPPPLPPLGNETHPDVGMPISQAQTCVNCHMDIHHRR
jgi:predicted CxxxxCH...CXXCH cytochrome family protein